MDPLKQQYEEYPYPDISQSNIWQYEHINVSLHGCPSVWHEFYWGVEKIADQFLEILSAGCGATQAAQLAIKNPQSSIVGVDLSSASIRSANSFKEKWGLGNLSLQNQDILEHQGSYDFIMCTGVIHHTPDPKAYLAHLGKMLKPGGKILLQVYSECNRIELREFKKILRKIGIKADEKGILALKEILARLPGHHPASVSRQKYTDLTNDPGLVDFFLNAREIEFNIQSLLKLISDANLKVYSWTEPWKYDPDFFLPDAQREVVSRLPLTERWEIAEQLYHPISMHSIVLCKPADYSLVFDNLPHDNNSIKWRPGLVLDCDPEGTTATLDSRTKVRIPRLTREIAEFIKYGGSSELISQLDRDGILLRKLIQLGVIFSFKST